MQFTKPFSISYSVTDMKQNAAWNVAINIWFVLSEEKNQNYEGNALILIL